MGRLTCGVELLHPWTQDSPVIRHHCRQHRRHADDDRHRCDLDLCHLLLKHVAASGWCAPNRGCARPCLPPVCVSWASDWTDCRGICSCSSLLSVLDIGHCLQMFCRLHHTSNVLCCRSCSSRVCLFRSPPCALWLVKRGQITVPQFLPLSSLPLPPCSPLVN